jgi:hypothetical protein
MGIEERDQSEDEPRCRWSRLASRRWALLLVRIYECLPLLCPKCNEPMQAKLGFDTRPASDQWP